MANNGGGRIAQVLKNKDAEILQQWLVALQRSGGMREDLIPKSEVAEQCSEFLMLISDASTSGNLTDLNASEWAPTLEMLGSVSRSRARQGFTPSEVASFVFSLKEPLFEALKQEYAGDTQSLVDSIWAVTGFIDKLGLYTTDVYIKGREELILRQQEELLELSTPVVKLWNGILALPIIGTLDSARTQIVMENLLQAIVDTEAEIAIIDITGVPTVDTLVSQHLLKTVAAARLMGAECIISGIRPQIAQTIVHLGVDLAQVTTKATLADAFLMALRKTGNTISRPTGARG